MYDHAGDLLHGPQACGPRPHQLRELVCGNAHVETISEYFDWAEKTTVYMVHAIQHHWGRRYPCLKRYEWRRARER